MTVFSDNPAVNWLLIGMVLLGLEIFSGTFVLMFFAFGAFAAAAATWLGLLSSIPWQIVFFATLSGAALFFFRGKLRVGLKGRGEDLKSDVGTAVRLEADVLPGDQTEVQYQGARWIAVNETGRPLVKGSDVRVAAVDGVKLIIK
jgi:membrane protein implicated in regulation of membrane protease activity